jgi:hypothetical protein
MNSEEYKSICTKPDVLQIAVLESTLKALKKEGAKESSIVETVLATAPIEFPKNFQGDESSRHFKVNCSEEEAEAITDILFELEASSVPLDGIATSETYQFVDLVNTWSELTEYVARNV